MLCMCSHFHCHKTVTELYLHLFWSTDFFRHLSHIRKLAHSTMLAFCYCIHVTYHSRLLNNNNIDEPGYWTLLCQLATCLPHFWINVDSLQCSTALGKQVGFMLGYTALILCNYKANGTLVHWCFHTVQGSDIPPCKFHCEVCSDLYVLCEYLPSILKLAKCC